ncbi:MAG: cyclodeaminase/cyclohydrolase family protein, partial [Oscillospiraceae bacterium]|nr:cyclodeaminase/cyclohydrolase family protein [Oscillospiraceae bacterium]
LSLIDQDAAGFAPLAAAYAIPKTDPARGEKLRSASLTACEAPLEMLRRCGETAQLLGELEERVSPLLLSDLGCAAALCAGALEAAAMNIWVNVKGLKDDEEAMALRREALQILDTARPLAEAIAARARARLLG